MSFSTFGLGSRPATTVWCCRDPAPEANGVIWRKSSGRPTAYAHEVVSAVSARSSRLVEPGGRRVLGGWTLVMGIPLQTSVLLWQTLPVWLAVAGVNSKTSWLPVGTFVAGNHSAFGCGAPVRRARAAISAASVARLEMRSS